MFHTLLEGVILGFTMSILMGPAFFSLIQTSIHRGFKSGMLLAIGIFISDAVILWLGVMGASRLIYEGPNALIFGIVGGIVLIVYGIVTFRRPIFFENGDVEARAPRPTTYILKGFFLNFANPFLWIFWMSIVVLVTSNYIGHPRYIYLFFMGVLLTTISSDFVKCFISHKIKKFLNSNVLKRINHIVGVILIIFGIVLIVRVILNFTGWLA